MQNKKKRGLSLFLALVIMLTLLAGTALTATAANATVSIAQSDTEAQLLTKIQNAIDGAGSGSTITVTGSKTGLSSAIELDIPAGVSVVWKAELSSAVNQIRLIILEGEGAFELAEGGSLSIYNWGAAIWSGDTDGTNDPTGYDDFTGTIKVSGGSVTIDGGKCIRTQSADVIISGGVLTSNDASGTIHARDGDVTMSGGTIAAFDGEAVWAENGKVTVTGGKIIAIKTSTTIWADNGNVTISGGAIFSYGDDAGDVIDCGGTLSVEGNGMVIAWDANSGFEGGEDPDDHLYWDSGNSSAKARCYFSSPFLVVEYSFDNWATKAELLADVGYYTYWTDDDIRAENFLGGDHGEPEDDELYIDSAAELGLFANKLIDDGLDAFEGMTIILANDIDLSSHFWQPVNMYDTDFDGNSKTISGIKVNTASEVPDGEVAGMFGLLELSSVCSLIFESPVIEPKNYWYWNLHIGVIAGIGVGVQIREVTINNPTVIGRANDHIMAGGVIGYTKESEEENRPGLHAGVINGAEVYGGEILIDANNISEYETYQDWEDGAIIYAGGVAGANYNSAVVNAAVYGTKINIKSEKKVEIWSVFVGGIAGYTSTTEVPDYGTCILNVVSTAWLGVPNLTAHYDFCIGGIAGMVLEDSVVNTVYIGDQDYDIFGSQEAGDYTISHNYKYATAAAARADGIVNKMNDKTENTGGLWVTAKVMNDDTDFGFEASLARLKTWTYKNILGAANTLAFGSAAAPTITGPDKMTVTEGYAAISTEAYALTGDPAPEVTLSGDTDGDKITWNSDTKKLDIASGLAAGTYAVTLTVSNGINPDTTADFTLTVNPADDSTDTSTESEPSPNTGSNSNIMWWLLFGCVALGSLTIAKKRRMNI